MPQVVFVARSAALEVALADDDDGNAAAAAAAAGAVPSFADRLALQKADLLALVGAGPAAAAAAGT